MNNILDQLRTTFSSSLTSRGITTFFKGRQKIELQSDLPLLSVYPISTHQRHTGTVRDSTEYEIGIEIAVNLKNYFNSNTGQGTQLETLDALIDIVEERETDGDLKTNTIMGIINANITVNGKVLYTDDMQVNYETYLDAREFPVAKSTVTFRAFDRPNRL